MKTKKGQMAMEFLMTYGWAILVVLFAIGMLAYFGVLSPQKLLPQKSQTMCDKFTLDINPNCRFDLNNDSKIILECDKEYIFNNVTNRCDIKTISIILNGTYQ